jgi:hypothetical protein
MMLNKHDASSRLFLFKFFFLINNYLPPKYEPSDNEVEQIKVLGKVYSLKMYVQWHAYVDEGIACLIVI